jgi:hypothetical protein
MYVNNRNRNNAFFVTTYFAATLLFQFWEGLFPFSNYNYNFSHYNYNYNYVQIANIRLLMLRVKKVSADLINSDRFYEIAEKFGGKIGVLDLKDCM